MIGVCILIICCFVSDNCGFVLHHSRAHHDASRQYGSVHSGSKHPDFNVITYGIKTSVAEDRSSKGHTTATVSNFQELSEHMAIRSQANVGLKPEDKRAKIVHRNDPTIGHNLYKIYLSRWSSIARNSSQLPSDKSTWRTVRHHHKYWRHSKHYSKHQSKHHLSKPHSKPHSKYHLSKHLPKHLSNPGSVTSSTDVQHSRILRVTRVLKEAPVTTNATALHDTPTKHPTTPTRRADLTDYVISLLLRRISKYWLFVCVVLMIGFCLWLLFFAFPQKPTLELTKQLMLEKYDQHTLAFTPEVKQDSYSSQEPDVACKIPLY